MDYEVMAANRPFLWFCPSKEILDETQKDIKLKGGKLLNFIGIRSEVLSKRKLETERQKRGKEVLSRYQRAEKQIFS